jgi:hypothetical protein
VLHASPLLIRPCLNWFGRTPPFGVFPEHPAFRGIYNKYLPAVLDMVANALPEEPSRPRTANSIPDRQLRPRNRGGSKAPLSLSSKASSRGSSTMSDMTGAHRRPSRTNPLHLPADRVRMSSRSSPPPRTKTGRISKAKKGQKVHKCYDCGKVLSSKMDNGILTICRCTAGTSI